MYEQGETYNVVYYTYSDGTIVTVVTDDCFEPLSEQPDCDDFINPDEYVCVLDIDEAFANDAETHYLDVETLFPTSKINKVDIQYKMSDLTFENDDPNAIAVSNLKRSVPIPPSVVAGRIHKHLDVQILEGNEIGKHWFVGLVDGSANILAYL